jgi:hypothetical protein
MGLSLSLSLSIYLSISKHINLELLKRILLLLFQILYRRWPFGPDTEVLCRLANAGQHTPVFMSSLSIVAIALDRYVRSDTPTNREGS